MMKGHINNNKGQYFIDKYCFNITTNYSIYAIPNKTL